MAYSKSDLIALGYGPGAATVWMYRTNDTLADVMAAGYFNGAAELLKVGDLIMTALDVDGTPATRTLIVSSNDGSTVAVTKSDISA